MLSTSNMHGIVKYLFFSVLTLSSKCLAGVSRDDSANYNTTRIPENFTVPTYMPAYSDFYTDEEDKTIFFVVLSLSVFFIGILAYICQRGKSSSSSGSSPPRLSGGVVHPPPIHLNPTTVRATAPPVVSYTNVGYRSDVLDSRPSDVPPDYATVAIGDLSTQDKSKFPMVNPNVETPPPQYQAPF